jgi:hypothetical protein
MQMSEVAAAKARMAELGSLSFDDPVASSKMLIAEYDTLRGVLLSYYGPKGDAKTIDPWAFRRYETLFTDGVFVLAASYSMMQDRLEAAEKSGYPDGGDRFDPDISQWNDTPA